MTLDSIGSIEDLYDIELKERLRRADNSFPRVYFTAEEIDFFRKCKEASSKPCFEGSILADKYIREYLAHKTKYIMERIKTI